MDTAIFSSNNCQRQDHVKTPEFKKESCLQDSPPATGRFSDIIPLRRSAILPGGLFMLSEHYGVISYNIKSRQKSLC